MTAPATDSLSGIVGRIDRDLAWWEAQGRGMKSQKDALAFAVVIGASKALTDLRAAIRQHMEKES